MFDKNSLFLIDGTYRMYKAFFAVPGLTTPDGAPINAVYGFAGSLLKLIKQENPTYLAVCFDVSDVVFRTEIYPEYKATRKAPPDDMIAQHGAIRRLLAAMNIPVLEKKNFEADDLMGTLAARFASNELHVYLCTNDKDAKQLLGANVSMYDLDAGQPYTVAHLKAETGLDPQQIIELMALTGDTSDNVPGVPKIGEKTALPFIQKYHDLETILANADEIAADESLTVRGRASAVARIKEFAEQARLSRRLVTIDTNVEIEGLALDGLKFAGFDKQKLLPVFQEFGFTKYTRDLELIKSAPVAEAPADYRCVDTVAALDAMLAALAGANVLSVDTETTGPDPLVHELVGISLAAKPHTGFYLPIKAPDGETVLPLADAVAKLKPLLENPAVAKIGHNIKFDMHVLSRVGIELGPIGGDSMVAAYLLNPGRQNLGLDHLAVEFLGRENISIASLIGTGKNQKTMDQVPVADVVTYAAEDADVALRLFDILSPQLATVGLTELATDLEYPMVEVLAGIERRGVSIDVEYLKKLGEELKAATTALETDIYGIAGREFNIRSTKQLADILFKERGFTSVKKTKSGDSTDEYVLETLAAQKPGDPLPAKILAYREAHKLLSTYVEALPKYVNPQTHRVHSSFNQCVTPTGRLSSADPNLQNIPIRTEYGRRIREAIVPASADRVLLAVDYSQIELRLVAHLSGDPTMCAAFKKGADIHKAVAAKVHGIMEGLVTPQMRNEAKAVNFGIIYGQTAFGLSANLGISKTEAQTFIDDYFATFPAVREYIAHVIAAAHANGFVTTVLGRRRYLPELSSSNKAKKERAEREAVNTTVQGSAADLIKIAMVRLHRAIAAEHRPLEMILQVHDELVFECPEESIEEQAAFVRGTMESAMELSVPLLAEASWGHTWKK